MSDDPPVASTLPSGRIVRFRCVRAYAIDAVCTQCGVGCVVSSTYVVAFDGVAPPLSAGADRYELPAFMNLPGWYITPLPASSSVGSTIDHVCVATSSAYVGIFDSSDPVTITRPSGCWNTNE